MSGAPALEGDAPLVEGAGSFGSYSDDAVPEAFSTADVEPVRLAVVESVGSFESHVNSTFLFDCWSIAGGGIGWHSGSVPQ